MNKRIRFLMVGLMLLPLSAIAANAVMESATPVQSYQSANTANSSNQKWIDPTQSSTMSKPTQPTKQPTKKVAANSTQQKTPITTQKTATAVAFDRQGAQILQAELTQLNQSNLLFQQKIDEHLIKLDNRNQLLEQKIRRLTQALILLNQEMVQLKRTNASLNARLAQPVHQATFSTFIGWVQVLYKRLGPINFKVAVSAIVILIILLVWIIWPRNKGKKRAHMNRDPKIADVLDDTKTEYDYMGSTEGIPAKLDLARTYIAMEDYKMASKVLAEVTKHGDDEHKKQAQVMLDEIPAGL